METYGEYGEYLIGEIPKEIRVINKIQGEIVTFSTDPISHENPSDYYGIRNKLKEIGMEFPTFSENILLLAECPWLVHSFYNRFLLSSTVSLFVPNHGIYFKENPEICDGRVCMERSKLEKDFLKDPSVMFVPVGWATEIFIEPLDRFISHPIMRGLCEDAHALGEVSKHFSHWRPYPGIMRHLYIDHKIPKKETIGFPCFSNKLIYDAGLFVFPYRNIKGFSYGIKKRVKN
jgi:hypothetical protein